MLAFTRNEAFTVNHGGACHTPQFGAYLPKRRERACQGLSQTANATSEKLSGKVFQPTKTIHEKSKMNEHIESMKKVKCKILEDITQHINV